MRKVIEIGLDGLHPELVTSWADNLPNLLEMQREGIWGPMQSTVPPAAPVAWACAQTGMNPGAFGFWDFTYRDDYTYGHPKAVSSESLKVDPLYKALPIRGQKVAIINLPFTWPTPVVAGGYAISDFAPSNHEEGYTWPKTLAKEVTEVIGDYILEAFPRISEDQNRDQKAAQSRIMEMDTQRFTLLKYFITKKKCDYIVSAITGVDRLARLFYRYFDTSHKQYEDNPAYANALLDHYKFMDKEIGKIREIVDDQTTLFIHSNSGILRLDGRINLNEWLIEEGYLTLREYPQELTEFKDLQVDWSKTKVWSVGYNGAVYLNLKERDSEGVVEASQYNEILEELIAKLSQLSDDNGNAMDALIYKREDIHKGPNAKYGPDLIAFFNNGHWKTNEIVGSNGLHSFGTPHGPDDATDGLYGYFCLVGPDVPPEGQKQDASIMDIAPTVCCILKEPMFKKLEGKSLVTIEEDKKQVVHDSTRIMGY